MGLCFSHKNMQNMTINHAMNDLYTSNERFINRILTFTFHIYSEKENKVKLLLNKIVIFYEKAIHECLFFGISVDGFEFFDCQL